MDTEYLKRVGMYIAGAVISICLIAYFGYHIWRTFTPEVAYEHVGETTITKTASAGGYIFRDEIPLSGTKSGSLVPLVNDGERLPLGGAAAKVYSSVAPDAVKRIAEIDEQLVLLLECTGDKNVTLKDASRFDLDLYSIMTDIRTGLANGNTGNAASLRSALISGTNKKLILTEGLNSINDQLNALQSEKQALMSQLGSVLETINAAKSGYYYSHADGYEELFLPSKLETIDYDTLSSLVSSAPAATSDYGKIVHSTKWYYVCFVDRAVASLFTEGEERELSFTYNGGTAIKMTLERLIRGTDGYACVFSTSYLPGDFEYTRAQPVKISMTEYTGFKVRANAVRIIGGDMGVYVLDGSTVRFRRISIICENEGSYIVETNPEGDSGDYEWLKLHDVLITEGTGLYHGRILGK